MKMHLNLATRGLEASVAFYSTLLGAQPAKKLGDYALFITEQHEDTENRDDTGTTCCRAEAAVASGATCCA